MNFWHIQLHPGEFENWSAEDIREILKESLIGCSGTPVPEFNKIRNGDIVLVRHGGTAIALVKAVEDPRPTLVEEKIDPIWFDTCCKVDILKEYEGDNISDKGLFLATTIQSIKRENNIAYNYINDLYKTIMSRESNVEIIDLLKFKNQIILQGPPGTGKTRMAKDIAEQIIFGKVSNEKKIQAENLENSIQYKLVQFHPSFSYEDFVRGIVVKTDNSTTLEYKIINKILGEFAKTANESNYEGGTDDFDRAWYELIQDINDGKVTKVGSSDVDVYINTQGNIRFKSPVATYEKTYELYKFGKTDLKYETYNKIVLNFLKDKNGKYKMNDFVSPKSISSNKPYVLIIDEINRANLPAVLGELIYALEYRGEKVESMYATTEEGNALILPPNLFIIGTMNTSDRSVGHIDYAIRRRFAFVDVLPKVLDGDNFEPELFKQISALFIKNFDEYVQDNAVELKISEHLSEEFRPEDVWLGHSYFIKNENDFALRKKYEIVPILKEYIKDGILKQSAEPIINAL